MKNPESYLKLFREVSGPLVNGKYIHWDKLGYYDRPDNFTLEEWWYGLKLHRIGSSKTVPLFDKVRDPFTYALVEPLPEFMHWVDFSAGGTIQMPEQVTNSESKKQYLVRSLIEEAYTSSQLEGAGTTRERAKELIRKNQTPRDRGERMVLNNYKTMDHILSLRDEPLTKDVVVEIQRMITDGTLEDPACAARFRRSNENIIVGDAFGDVIYHIPPPAAELEERMELMCSFANGKIPGHFVHPVIRSMILHFWLAYDHPFVDGNGRTARALFYWSMLRHGYWLFEYVSISNIILQGPMKYERAFLETESDGNDLTYFILYHTEVIQRAVSSLHAYIRRKTDQLREAVTDLRAMLDLNHRQRSMLSEALRHPGEAITVESHRHTHGVVTQTARADLIDLVDRGLLTMSKSGRAYTFYPVPDLADRLRRSPDS